MTLQWQRFCRGLCQPVASGLQSNTQQAGPLWELQGLGLPEGREHPSPWADDQFTFFNFKAVAPLLQGDVLILVGVTLFKEARYAVFHGHERCSQRRELRVGQDPATRQMAAS